MADIFISYASEDRSRVEPLAKALEDQGWTVFWDRTIPAGKTWRQVIGDALETSRSVIVAWSKTSVDSSWVQEEADRGRERNILIPILIDNVKPPLGFGAIQAADLVSWEPTQSSPQFEKLVSDLSAILGPSPIEIKEAEQKREEEERRRKQEQERGLREEEQKRIEVARKAEEEHKKKEADAKRKAEEEQKRRAVKEEIKPDKPEPGKVKPPEPKPDAKALTEPRPSPSISPKSHKSRTALILGSVAGVIVLLMTGGWFYYKYQLKQETLSKIEGFHKQAEELEREFAKVDKQEDLKEFSRQRKELSIGVESLSEQAAKVGVGLQFKKLKNRLIQVQLQEETLFRIEDFHKEVEELERAVAKVDKQEDLKEFSSKRKALSDQVEGLSEKAVKVGLASQFKELQNRLEQVQLQEETLFKIEGFKEQVKALEGAAATVDKLEQIEKLYSQRDTLNNRVAAFSEQATEVGLQSPLEQLQDRLKQIQIQLANKEKELISARKGKIFVASAPDNATVKILNIGEPFQQGMELEPGKYHVQVSSEDYEPQERWIELGPGEEKRINFELAKIKVAEPIQPQKAMTNSIGMKLVLIPAGSFTMGSQLSAEEIADRHGGVAEWYKDEQPPHHVQISKVFYLQSTEVTQGQWKRIMGDNPSHFKDCGDDCPVEEVSWNDAQKFISKLNQMEGTNKYRLPTEAEWEYACRAKTTTPFFTGDCISTDQANYDGSYPGKNCSEGTNRGKTVKVKSFKPNAWGLYDMHGNVWEWCQDWHGDYSSGPITDPEGPDKGNNRMLRGGSWLNLAKNIRSSDRFWDSPDFALKSTGFRVAMDL